MSDDATIAAERIEVLAEQAREAARTDHPDRARECVRRARRVAERHRLSLPASFERFVCDRCDAYLRPGRNARVRTQSGHVVVTCECGSQARYPYADSQ
ncbi:ribonuclease P [Halorhabdus sp. CBA1104]|uniref:ribonuclease P protein component 4 n=1 Tax=Halorhabdus sp. CBA1104 TaxID=1380432 RepID=UPI0012B25261|nr:ribonuclease P [Halorhabdus sp. CBA1104]QGN08171.1 ribonuclease P [Halorhabdus sp. CBA1104]